jgi:hypothetical protein
MAPSAAAVACPVRLRGLDRHRHVHEVDAQPKLRGGGERRGGAVSPGKEAAAEAKGSEVETERGVEHNSMRGRGKVVGLGQRGMQIERWRVREGVQ